MAQSVQHHAVLQRELTLRVGVREARVVQDLLAQRLSGLLDGRAADVGLAGGVGARVVGRDVGVLEAHDVDVLGAHADGLGSHL